MSSPQKRLSTRHDSSTASDNRPMRGPLCVEVRCPGNTRTGILCDAAGVQLAIAPEVMLTELDLRKVAVAGAFDDLRRETMATMSHYSRVLKVVIDAPPDLHDQELAFWQGALGQELPESYSAEYHGAFLRGNDLMLLMQRLESGAPRVHLDIHTDDLDAEVARLERLGAERVQKVQTWWVMRDPAGLLFCVLPMSPGSLNDENAQRWE